MKKVRKLKAEDSTINSSPKETQHPIKTPKRPDSPTAPLTLMRPR